ncbi:MAG TPA: methylmalonyl Co-A mutase-associated GTPase MeaB [Acidimicrobiales bacterium]|nr:methylmalonyl Co-A mutase-associated GTPase MeaB [Acidimicrobiales bacterium]
MTGPAGPIELLDAARRGDRVALARLLTIVENDTLRARSLAAMTWTSQRAFSIGVTGAPGAGKSTLTDRMIATSLERFTAPGASEPVRQVGVLCVDPTSPFSGGAILGDRVRMQDHALDERVFIRSLATRGHHGGLSVAVPDALALLGAAGFELALIETVGVGQVELDVAATADVTVVVVTPGWGDSMQTAKAGLLEVADVFVVNKADRPGAADARRDLEQMLELGTGRDDGWLPPIVETVATEDGGTHELFDALDALRARLDGDAGLARRRARAASLLRRLAAATIAGTVDGLAAGGPFEAAVDAVAAGELDPYAAVDALLAT